MLIASSTQNRTEQYSAPRLLLVDDDFTTLALLKRLFESEYHIYTAGNGEEALAVLAKHEVDLVLLDVQMPRMNGFTFLETIRSQEATRTLPVIIISSNTDTRDVVHGLQLGANDYINKPMNTHITRARVQTQLSLKQANDAKDETISRLHGSQEFQNQFYRIASHDLKGPLTNLRLGHYMLRDFVKENAEANGILDNMDLTLNSMLEMIHSFLDASKYQQGIVHQQIDRVNVGDYAHRVIEQYTPAAKRKQIKLNMERLDCPVFADHVMLGQMLDNLISNAIKFSLPDTTVRVSAERRGDMIRVAVEDQGPGIPVEERGRLFEMFSRLTPRPTGQESSTGLGLWIVKTLATIQNGCVGADFPADGGSIFWFEIPAA